MTNPLRARLGRELHRIIDARLEQARRRWLQQPQVFGSHEHLAIHPTAVVNDALFNTTSGTVTIGEHVFFGHGVMVLCGDHDITKRGEARKLGYKVGRDHGFDVVIEDGAWLASRAVVIGPCRIGANAVVCAGAVVTHDVEPATMVAGIPARVIRRVPIDAETPVGPMYLHAHDEVITPDLVAGRADPDVGLIASLAREAGVVLDVGANVGFTALTAARAGAHVVAVEPHPDNLRLLRANVERNHADVEVVAAAAWDAAGTVTLAEATTNTGDHRAGVHVAGRSEVEVPAVRLDDIATGSVGLVKLDTQATEHVALRGARELIARCRPVILAEFWPQGIRNLGEDPAAVVREYAELGYRVTVVEEPGLADIVSGIDARPGPEGGFATLRLDPLQ